ncbi:MAG TPA: glycosyltransferase [Anaerolineae bacterium]|nr:glycosyltransferase [Anaerolineae bacterium]
MPIHRVAMLSVHTCPLATLGGKETGGMNVYVRDLAREFSRRGILVDVFTRSQNSHLPHVMHKLGAHGRVVHVPAGPEQPYDKNKVFDHLPEFTAGVLRFARDEGLEYDMIHSHYWLSGWVARELRAAWGKPIVHMFHTLGLMKNQVAGSVSELETGRRIDVETEVVGFADRLIAATPAEKTQLEWLYNAAPDRITVIPPGVDTRHFFPMPQRAARERIGVQPDDWMILFVGRIERLKGIDTLIRAIALLAHECPTWVERMCVAIIGGDPTTNENAELEHLKTMREQLGLNHLITFLGARDQDQLQHYYNAATFVVMPSRYESFGMVALEAMACGRPVLASEVGGLAYLVCDGETGFHVPEGDHVALAMAIARLLQDNAVRERLGRQAAAWAQNYAWPRIADQLLATFEAEQSLSLPTWAPLECA